MKKSRGGVWIIISGLFGLLLLLLLQLLLGFFDMGCGGSKADDLPLVIRCRERKALIKAAKDHRFALAAAHVSYFHCLNQVGDALRCFVDEELALPSPPASPVLTLPKTSKKKNTNENNNNKHSSSSSTSLSHSGSGSHIHLSEDEDDDHDDLHHHGHLHLSSSGSDSELDSSRNHMRHSPEIIEQQQQGYPPSYYYDDHPPPPQTGWGDPYPYAPPEISSWGVYPPSQTDWGGGQFGVYNPTYSTTNTTSTAYYMKRSKPQIQSVIYDPAAAEQRSRSSYSTYTMDMNSAYPTSYQDQSAGFFGFVQNQQPSPPPTSYPDQSRGFFGFLQNQQQSTPPGPPPPPSPKVSGWDFLNPFDMFDSGGYSGYYSSSYGQKDGYGSIASSPDSNEVREREGIPDLEDETDPETFRRAVHHHHHHFKGRKKSSQENRKNYSGEGTSRAVPSHKQRHSSSDSRPVPLHKESSEGSSSSKTVLSHDNGSSEGGTHSHRGIHSREAPSQYDEVIHSVDVKEENSSPDTILTSNTENGSVRKKGVTFEVDAGPSTHDNGESSKLSSLTTLSPHGTRDIQEVVAEIRDEFAMASSYSKEVAMLLEVGKLPYQSRFTLLKVILSGIPCMKAHSLSSSSPPSRESVRVATSTMKLAKAYYGDSGSNSTMKSDLSSTLEKLYEWEKKLYKEVKDEEKLRLIYEKQCKRLKMLDDRGAESSKIDATQASIRKLLTKINVCIKAVDGISNRIHKLRDEELQPQVIDLIYGLIRMWKAMLKCHHKQFQAIKESKARSLIANVGSRRDSHLRATMELEKELHAWSSRFGNWIKSQKSFIESLNGWLSRCLLHEPEVTPDGIVPFSPGRIGAPPIFVICNDWTLANGSVSETGTGVTNAMLRFASSLRELIEKQEEEQKQRLETEYLSEDLEKRLRMLRMGSGRLRRDRDAMSDKTGVSIVASDDLKVDLDSIREKLKEGRAQHKEAIELVHSAASSSSIKAGLIPIFGALDNFTSEAVKAYEHVRIQNAR
ncbi:hypothetical protein RHMOL_Rhmol06G0152200 [Rhododendron molle]|uniref:Uncharacterized protein n=1 Tax=Rhododendron molle TaxID=49168 RepID=A0ACC0NE22_RHOML|nr:hypothetical protein RHMOL_Rhmol06G0152200 [Rhododendron molle]